MTTEADDTAAPEPAAEAPEPDASAPAPAPASEPADEAPEPDAAERKPRPRGRTALIMAAALVLGVVGGAGVGYAVQYDRKPTPLPPFSVAQPQYPTRHIAAPALPAAEDDQVKTDGDLLALLVPVPAGSKPWSGESSTTAWLDLADYAETRSGPAGAFRWYSQNHFRRAVQALWVKGGISSEVRLVQFTHADDAAAGMDVSQQQGYQDSDPSVSVPGSEGGKVFPGTKLLSDAGGTYYAGYAYVLHGDISVQIRITSDHPVSASSLLALVQSQLERL